MPGMDWKDVPSLALPFIYDMSVNVTQVAERREQVPSFANSAVLHHLRRFADYGGVAHNECSLFPAIRDLLTNLSLPNEGQPQPQPSSLQSQLVQSPAGAVGSSPGPMMHSPMPPMGQAIPSQQQQGYGMGPTGGSN